MTQDIQFTKVKHGRIYEAIVEQLQYLIVARKLQPGDQLLPERDLAEQFGVSRTAVRDAIKVLGEKGLVEVRPGAGTFVVQRVSDMVAQSMGLLLQIEDSSFASLQEVRVVLEAEVAGLAAERATEPDIDRMRRTLEEMGRIDKRPAPHSMDDFIGFTEADMEFHIAIAEATNNGVFPVLLGAMAELVEKARRMVMVVPDAPGRIIEHHRCILDAIQQQSRDQACEAMKQHMHQVTQDIKTALSQPNLLKGLDLD